jgi:peptide/nickel transport system permease protein
MWRFLARRSIQMLITLLLFQAATFFLIDAQPGDIADLLTQNPDIPPQQRDVLRRELGLDRPAVERFFRYIGNFYQGNLGVSFSQYPRPVTDIIAERLPRTVVLFMSASIVSFYAGFVTGKVLAWRRGGLVEYSSTLFGVVMYTVFTPWFALMMIWFFAVTLDWFPAGKFLDPIEWINAPVDANTIFIRLSLSLLITAVLVFAGTRIANRLQLWLRQPARLASYVLPVIALLVYWFAPLGAVPTGDVEILGMQLKVNELGLLSTDIFTHLILPVLTVTLIAYGGTMLLMRTSMLETLREDYILSARAKGLPDKIVRDKHAARNALLPVWTGLVFSIGNSVSGGIITESIFSWPGIGLTLLVATQVSDIPLALGTLTVIGVMTLLSHLVADIGYAFLDPRIRIH